MKKREEVIHVLVKGLKLYQEILGLSEQQKKVVLENNPSPLLTAIADRKETIINSIKKEETHLKEMMNPEIFRDDPAIAELREGVKSTLRKVLKTEDECIQHIEHTKNRICEEWNKLNRGKQAAKGYGTGSHYKRGMVSIKK